MTYKPVITPSGRPMYAVDADDPRGRSRAVVNRCSHCDALIAWVPTSRRRMMIPVMVTADPDFHLGTYEHDFEHTPEVCRTRQHLFAELAIEVESYEQQVILKQTSLKRGLPFRGQS